MAKVTLTDLTSLANDTSATNSINENFQTLEDYINDNVLSRDTGAETNTMQNDLDMNSYSVLNGGTISATTFTLNGVGLSTTPYAEIGGQEWVWTVSQTASTQSASVSGSVALDFAAYNNFVLTLTDNITLANPSPDSIGQMGFIIFQQDATGSRTLTLGSQWLTGGGAGITLSTGASAIDIVGYVVMSSTQILLGSPLKDYL